MKQCMNNKNYKIVFSNLVKILFALVSVRGFFLVLQLIA